jgi:hypothetical protein
VIEQDEEPAVAPAASSEVPFPRSYDFFKHTTGVSLISLGGIFAFADSRSAEFEPTQIVIVLGFIGLAGVISVVMVSSLATLEIKPEPPAKVTRWIRYAQFCVSFLLAAGLGSFIFNFTEAVL